MEKDRRQKRFEQKERNLTKWMKRARQRAFWEGRTAMNEWDEKNAHRWANHGKLCSCHMCGNPRKFLKEKTIQERKHEQGYREDYEKD